MKRVALLSMLVFIASTVLSQHDNFDCSTAYIVCSNNPIGITELAGFGTPHEIGETDCYEAEFTKTNSIWFKWKIGTPGDLGFSIIPMKENDDLDFVLYKMNNGVDDCTSRKEIRCMVSGQNKGEEEPAKSGKDCLGITGLSSNSIDKNEEPGCSESNDNFLAEVQVNEGDIYALFINNYYSSSGFLIEFSGSAQISSDMVDCKPTGDPSISLSAPDELVFSPVYPNPARSEVILPVTATKPFKDGTLQLTGIHGDILKTKNFNLISGDQKIRIPIRELPVGIYFIKTVIEGNTHIARFSKF